MILERKLGFWDVFCIAAGAMISSGLFVLPGLAFAQAGPAVIVAYALAGLLTLPAVLTQAELASAMPISGGSYMYIERSLGTLLGTFAGLSSWFFLALKAAFALIGIGAFARLITPDTSEQTIKGIAIASCLLFAALNMLSVKGVGRMQVFMVVALLAILAVFSVWGLTDVRHTAFAGFADRGLLGVFATTGLVFISYGGITGVTNIAGEVRQPARNVPLAMLAAQLGVSALYVLVVFVVVGVTDGAELSGHLTPISLAAGKFMGQAGAVVLAAAAMLAYVTTANGGILEASRSPMAMSRDGLLPNFIQHIWPRFKTPAVSVAITAAFMIVVMAVLTIEELVKAASTMMLMFYFLSSLAVITMRTSKLQNYRPVFRTPLYPYLPIAGMVFYVLLIIDMGLVPLLVSLLFTAAGVVWYLIYVRPHINRESAFVYMVRNAVSKEIYRSELDEELKQIAIERDEITHDRFDRLIGGCAIVDLSEPNTADEVFAKVAQTMAPRLGMDKDKLLDLFRKREQQSSTVIQPGLAIPHVIVPGENLFDVCLVRAKEGIIYPNQQEPVRTAFVLVGSVDQRNYHLRALMAVAHIVQEHDFTKRWLDARSPEHLRDIVLLSSRQRHMAE